MAIGQDVYSAFAAKLFNCNYNEYLEFDANTNEPTLIGQYCRKSRKTAKFILCSMFFSTKKFWHKKAFRMINELLFFFGRIACEIDKEEVNLTN